MSMTELQLKLFRIPASKRIKLTPTQREVLAWVEYSGGRFAAWPRRFQARTLRVLMQHRLVQCTGHSPARYVVTPLGRAVRGRHESGRPGAAPKITSQFLPDTAEE
jgi:hypothetical protein